MGIYAAALDKRIKALASVAGFSPYRTSTSQYESIRNMSHLHGLIPRLGLFAERPQEVPVDFKEIISCIAPRPLMVVAPTLDRYTDNTSLMKSMEESKRTYQLYDKEKKLYLYQPKDINRMSSETLLEILQFFDEYQ